MAEARDNGYLTIPNSASIVRAGGREVGKLADFVWAFSPCILGGLMTKSIYNWGIRYFKSDKGSWTITKTDEGAGATAVLLFSFLLWRESRGRVRWCRCSSLASSGGAPS